MIWRNSALALSFAVVLFSGNAFANLVVNGSFETFNRPIDDCIARFGPSFCAEIVWEILPVGDADLPGWEVVFGDVDIVNTTPGTLDPNYDGAQYIDLNGTQPGAIETNFVSIPGADYLLTFLTNPNDDGLLVTVAGQTFTVAPGAAQVIEQSFSFTAIDPLTTLRFAATGAGAVETRGPLLDAVSVTFDGVVIVPAPALAGVFMIGLAFISVRCGALSRSQSAGWRGLPKRC